MDNYYYFNDFRKVVILFIKFLKKSKMIQYYYLNPITHSYINNIVLVDNNFKNRYPASMMYEYISSFIGVGNWKEKHSIITQLWRLFLLENIDKLDFIDNEKRKHFVSMIKYIITINRSHNSAVLMHFFEKYGIHS